MNYFIADTHFGHTNTKAMLDNRRPNNFRPFKSAAENDQNILSRWNNVVKDSDDVYICGDVSWYSCAGTCTILDKLRGNLHLIVGNHDRKLMRELDFRKRFVEIATYKELNIGDGEFAVLCHYPILAYKNHYEGWAHFYGHVHDTWEYRVYEDARRKSIMMSGYPSNAVNVGCMMSYMNWTPQPFEYLMTQLNELNKNLQNSMSFSLF